MHTKRIDTPKEKESEFPKLMINYNEYSILLALYENGDELAGILIDTKDKSPRERNF